MPLPRPALSQALSASRGSKCSTLRHRHPAAWTTNAGLTALPRPAMPLLGVGGGWRRLLGTGPGSSGDDPHAVLGVAPGASLDAIKEAYRRCALRWHPDRATDTGNEAANRNFRLATEAFAVLRNGVGGAPSSPGAALNRAGTGTALDNARVGGARGGPGTRLGGRGQGGFRGSGSTHMVPGNSCFCFVLPFLTRCSSFSFVPPHARRAPATAVLAVPVCVAS